MAGRIPQFFIDELIARVDIVEVIGSRVQLKKAGREFKACCPFHGEKTPSFTVSPDKQFYHCFGCGAHGTAIGFLMEHDRLSFVEAVEELAARLGLEVPREAGSIGRQDTGDDLDLYEVNARAAQFYRECLKEDARAIAYLKQRGLTGETAARFAIGYAPNSWNAVLKKFGHGAGSGQNASESHGDNHSDNNNGSVSQKENANDAARRALLAAGLIVERGAGTREVQRDAGSGYYDRFRDRIMFPIRDARGRVIAFGGRILDQGEPKYLNSPETPIFHKGKELYGLYEARQTRQTLQRLLIVEGYMDVVRLHQAGITYALATLGTATTAEHLNRIFRLAAEVIFCFDGDRAGRAAAWRALENALPQARDGRQIKFLFLPEGYDPDSLVGEEGSEKFAARLDDAVPLSEYLVEHLSSQLDLGHVDGRARLAELARPLLQQIPAGIYRELLISRLAEEVRMPASKLAALLNNADHAGSSDDDTRAGDARGARLPAVYDNLQRARSRRGATTGTRISAGRGGLVRQAIALLLNYPESASLITQVERLEGIEQPGVPLLSQLIQDLRARPAAHKAAVVERWRERPGGAHLLKLAAADSPLKDAPSAAKELQMALHTIASEWQFVRRTDELIEKDRAWGLSQQELLELNELLKARGRPAPPPQKP
jgi:DNA primase